MEPESIRFVYPSNLTTEAFWEANLGLRSHTFPSPEAQAFVPLFPDLDQDTEFNGVTFTNRQLAFYTILMFSPDSPFYQDSFNQRAISSIGTSGILEVFGNSPSKIAKLSPKDNPLMFQPDTCTRTYMENLFQANDYRFRSMVHRIESTYAQMVRFIENKVQNGSDIEFKNLKEFAAFAGDSIKALYSMTVHQQMDGARASRREGFEKAQAMAFHHISQEMTDKLSGNK